MSTSRKKILSILGTLAFLACGRGLNPSGPGSESDNDDPGTVIVEGVVSPTSAARGATLTISTAGIAQGTSVRVGGAVCANVSVISSSQLTCKVGPHRAGIVDVVLTIPGLLTTVTIPSAFTYKSFLYVGLFSSGGGLKGFSVDGETGIPAPLPENPLVSGVAYGNRGLYLDPLGEFLFTLETASTNFHSYRIDPLTGLLTEVAGSPVSFSVDSDAFVVTPDGTMLIGVASSGGITGFERIAVDRATGALSQLATLNLVTNPSTFSAITPDGRFLYAGADQGNVTFEGFQRSGNSIVALADNDFGDTHAVTNIAIPPAGDRIFATYFQSLDIGEFPLNPATGALGEPAYLTTSSSVIRALIPHPTQRYLYALFSGEPTGLVTAWNDDGLVQGSALSFQTGSDPVAMTFDPNGTFGYTLSNGQDSLFVLRFNATDGTLEVVGGSLTGDNPTCMVLD